MQPSFRHYHIVFTLPGRLTGLLFETDFKPEILNRLAAEVYQKSLRISKATLDMKFKAGVMSTVHIAGNGLNFNPHVHMVATRDLVDIETGEIKEVNYFSFKDIRLFWQTRLLNYLYRKRFIDKEEQQFFKENYKNGFHAYFQPIQSSDEQNPDEILFRTAEYLGTNILHNSQIENVDHQNKRVAIKFRNWVERKTKKSHYKTLNIDVYEFMARMLYFLPDKFTKTIRYYGIYARPARQLKTYGELEKPLWAEGIKHLFDTDPEQCPKCKAAMTFVLIFAKHAKKIERILRKKHILINGYFYLAENGAANIRGP